MSKLLKLKNNLRLASSIASCATLSMLQIPVGTPLRLNDKDHPLWFIKSEKGFGVDYWNERKGLIKHDRFDLVEKINERFSYYRAAKKQSVRDHHIVGAEIDNRIDSVSATEKATLNQKVHPKSYK